MNARNVAAPRVVSSARTKPADATLWRVRAYLA
jgi:hypothetical protein